MNPAVFENMRTHSGRSLADMSQDSAVLLVFLRHFGCAFCRKAISDLSLKRADLQRQGVEIVFVHMADHAAAETFFRKYRLEGIAHISDPGCRYYSVFGLVKGSNHQLFGLQSLVRGFVLGYVEGYGHGKFVGDGFQMPGVFVIKDRQMISSFVHQHVSDEPDYEQLLACCTNPVNA